jgi:Polysaccharide deacetylase
MKRRIVGLLLRIARYAGLFALARALTARDLRILCYHGAALDDEHKFRPGLFMTGATFARRMRFLAAGGYPVLPLGEALQRLENGTLPRNGTVITIDDGWLGTFKVQVPALRAHGFPATLYIATYYLQNQTQVFNVALGYVLWKSGARQFDLAKIGRGLNGAAANGVADAGAALQRLIALADSLDSAAARQSLLRDVCDALGISWKSLEDRRLISFMNPDEARQAAAGGVDIQLHSHRHRFPDTGLAAARTEIEDNRRALAGVATSELRHFCYPSGVYTPVSLSYLPQLGIASATTTNPGFNRKGASPYELTRFLDSELISDLEFEAEMSGFLELARRAGLRV